MSGEKERVDAYLDTIGRVEPYIAMIDESFQHVRDSFQVD